MATLVFFHAHPDDETIATGGTMAKTADQGHRVVLVIATRGEHGEIVDGVLTPGEELAERRVAESHRSGEILGVARVEFLGYVDSGMMGEPTNDATGSFWSADVEEAARRLAVVLREERADVLTCYDDNGGYGHPDHIQVHRVGVRATELAGTPQVFEATINRDAVMRLSSAYAHELPPDVAPPGTEEELAELGVPEKRITTAVDVRDVLDRKRAAMTAHASQIAETSWFLSLPPDVYEAMFGTEWYIHRGVDPTRREAQSAETGFAEAGLLDEPR